jgi:hypothetical protein
MLSHAPNIHGAGTDGLAEDDLFLRRVPSIWVVEGDDGLRPSSQAFNNDPEGGPMSGYLDGLFARLGLERHQVVEGMSGFFVAGLTVGFLVREQQEVRHDPIDPPKHCCDPAHAGVSGSKANKRRARFAKSARWVPGLAPERAPDP